MVVVRAMSTPRLACLMQRRAGIAFHLVGFLAFQDDDARPNNDRLFCSAPDSAQIQHSYDTSPQNLRFSEYGMFLELPGKMLQCVSTNPESTGATPGPLGYGNELAVQFDRTSPEFAIVTDSAIHIIKRRRLVDIFAAALRYGEGSDTVVERFARSYGSDETAATALAVACGQGIEATSDARFTKLTDPDVREGARKAFIYKCGALRPTTPTL